VAFYTFNPQYPEPFSLIHPLKLKDIQNLLDCVMPAFIDCVILFGSSLDLTCSPYSDVDLYVISDEDKAAYEFFHRRCKTLKIKADILAADKYAFMEDALDINAIERQILKQGVVLYEKKSHTA